MLTRRLHAVTVRNFGEPSEMVEVSFELLRWTTTPMHKNRVRYSWSPVKSVTISLPRIEQELPMSSSGYDPFVYGFKAMTDYEMPEDDGTEKVLPDCDLTALMDWRWQALDDGYETVKSVKPKKGVKVKK